MALDPLDMAMLSGAALVGLVVVALAVLRGWHEWIGLQRLALDGHRAASDGAVPAAAARIELSDLKERVRKLEAIAAGVDL